MNLKRSNLILKTVILAALLQQSVVASEHAAKSSRGFAMPLQSLGFENISVTVLVTCNQVLTAAQKERFYAMGVETIVYAGGLSYYFYLPESLSAKIAAQKIVASVTPVDAKMRLSQEKAEQGALTVLGDDDMITVNVLFLKEMERNEIEALLARDGVDATIRKVTPQLRSAQLRLRVSAYKKLSGEPLIQYMDRVQSLLATDSLPAHPLETRNAKTAHDSHVAPLWSAPYNLDGRNMVAGVVDGGAALTTHQEFGGRVHDETSTHEVNFHATHVCGTIAAAGVNPKAHGMANEAEIYSYYFSDDAFADAVLKMYDTEGILISNHSYGYSLKERLGEYDSVAMTQDMAVANNPYLNIFEAAGNDGIDPDYAEYGIIKGPGNSKNIFTIGALDASSDDVAELSSAGPVRDGRIKPDLCVRGEYVTSASSESDSSYAMMSGTSMATPAATGIGLLVAEAYKRVTGGYDIRHDTLKAILINTATDVANPGPDYKAGFGLINARAAVDLVQTISGSHPQVTTGTIRHNGEIKYNFRLGQGGGFKTTIAWVDPEANPSSAQTLVNDIDMVLVNSDTGTKYYPYTLDKSHPSRFATRAENHVDNIEQIETGYIPAGNYTLIVKGTRIVTDTQEYTIASSLPLFAKSNIETLKPSKIQNFARKIFLSTF